MPIRTESSRQEELCEDRFLGVAFVGLSLMLQLLRSPLGQQRS